MRTPAKCPRGGSLKAYLGFKIFTAVVLLIVFAVLSTACVPAHAQNIPSAAIQHRSTLARNAQMVWGLNAPIATFAAQIHQESGWKPTIKSHVGAAGMAQFMPATATWWCKLNQLTPVECQPNNPTWAIRALVGYDLWLYNRVQGATEYDRMWAALRAYNGGLGHWQSEAKKAGSYNRLKVDAACGTARRHKSHCAENLGYPHRIITQIQPLYLSWGRGV